MSAPDFKAALEKASNPEQLELEQNYHDRRLAVTNAYAIAATGLKNSGKMCDNAKEAAEDIVTMARILTEAMVADYMVAFKMIDK